jgi:hypothetical protein
MFSRNAIKAVSNSKNSIANIFANYSNKAALNAVLVTSKRNYFMTRDSSIFQNKSRNTQMDIYRYRHTGPRKAGEDPRIFVEIFQTVDDAVKDIPSDSSLLVGGFGLVGAPEGLINGIRAIGAKNLTIISNEGNLEHLNLIAINKNMSQ